MSRRSQIDLVNMNIKIPRAKDIKHYQKFPNLSTGSPKILIKLPFDESSSEGADDDRRALIIRKDINIRKSGTFEKFGGSRNFRKTLIIRKHGEHAWGLWVLRIAIRNHMKTMKIQMETI